MLFISKGCKRSLEGCDYFSFVYVEFEVFVGVVKKDICGYGIYKRYWVDDKDLWVISIDIEVIEVIER